MNCFPQRLLPPSTLPAPTMLDWPERMKTLIGLTEAPDAWLRAASQAVENKSIVAIKRPV